MATKSGNTSGMTRPSVGFDRILRLLRLNLDANLDATLSHGGTTSILPNRTSDSDSLETTVWSVELARSSMIRM
uniref:Nucleotidyl transferase AbiEii/AbiGii toxin family protein n=1 Tax=Steinernema glaseri TaxID=37863 RepID=A0A1I7Z7P1_9BILA